MICLFFKVSAILIVTLHGISSPPCTKGDLLYVVDDKVANTVAPRCNKNFVGREISIGKWPTVFPVDPTYVASYGRIEL